MACLITSPPDVCEEEGGEGRGMGAEGREMGGEGCGMGAENWGPVLVEGGEEEGWGGRGGGNISYIDL